MYVQTDMQTTCVHVCLALQRGTLTRPTPEENFSLCFSRLRDYADQIVRKLNTLYLCDTEYLCKDYLQLLLRNTSGQMTKLYRSERTELLEAHGGSFHFQFRPECTIREWFSCTITEIKQFISSLNNKQQQLIAIKHN